MRDDVAQESLQKDISSFYGDRRDGAEDLEGHHWYFAQKVHEMAPEEACNGDDRSCRRVRSTASGAIHQDWCADPKATCDRRYRRRAGYHDRDARLGNSAD